MNETIICVTVVYSRATERYSEPFFFFVFNAGTNFSTLHRISLNHHEYMILPNVNPS